MGALAVLAFAGCVFAARALFGDQIRAQDPGWFVLDEACGLWIAAWRPHGISPWSILFAVAAFRVLDIVKPYPIGKLESAGDWGIVLDDAAAGALTLVLGLVLERILLTSTDEDEARQAARAYGVTHLAIDEDLTHEYGAASFSALATGPWNRTVFANTAARLVELRWTDGAAGPTKEGR